MSAATGGLPEFSPPLEDGANDSQPSPTESRQPQASKAAADEEPLLPPPQRPIRPVRHQPLAEPAQRKDVKKQPASTVLKSPTPPLAAKEAAAQATAAQATAAQVTKTGAYSNTNSVGFVDGRQHPISPPSEPRQYRAIGLVQGCYVPSEEQFNLGMVKTDADEEIDAVLLGRVTSLIKNHIDLTTPHLWVVYPRTRERNKGSLECDLHLQIVGVWEPETLNQGEENPDAPEEGLVGEADEAVEADEAAPSTVVDNPGVTDAIPTTDLPNNYFSIRGEVLRYSEETGHIVINIVQGSKQASKPPKSFRLTVQGSLEGKTVGYFWDLDVQRQGSALMMQSGQLIGIVPPKKRSADNRGKGRRPSKPFKGNRNGDRPRPVTRAKVGRPVPTGERHSKAGVENSQSEPQE